MAKLPLSVTKPNCRCSLTTSSIHYKKQREFSGDAEWLLQAAMLCLQINYGLSLKEHLPRTQERLEGDYLEHHCERSLNLCDWLMMITGQANPPMTSSCTRTSIKDLRMTKKGFNSKWVARLIFDSSHVTNQLTNHRAQNTNDWPTRFSKFVAHPAYRHF